MGPHNIQQQPKAIKILYWNANGIRPQVEQFKLFLLNEDIDIALINETHLTEKQKLNVPQYQTYRSDRNQYGGGTAILIKKGIKHSLLPTPNLTTIEATSCVVTTSSGDIQFTAVYHPPNQNINTKDIEALLKKRRCVIAGDLNCKNVAWNSRKNNSDGNKLLQHSNLNNYSIVAPNSNTFFPSQACYSPDVLDICILKGITSNPDFVVIPALDSDHNPVTVTLDFSPLYKIESNHRIKKIDWNLFSEYVYSNITGNPHINSSHDIDSRIKEFEQVLKSALKNSSIPAKHKSSNYTLPQDILNAIKYKNVLRKRWQKHHLRSDKSMLNKIIKQIKLKTLEYKNETWNSKLKLLNSQNKSLWQTTKAILNTPTIIPPLKISNGFACSDKDKANVFADYLENIFCPIPQTTPFANKIKTDVENYFKEPFLQSNFFTTPSEINKIIRKLKVRKSPGPDQISNNMIKHLPRKGITFITKLCNAIFKLNYFPTEWKKAKIIMIPKPG